MAERIMVGMSGGVDSSVAAALLLEKGYDVAGVTLHLHGGDGDASCGTLTDLEDAKKVCGRLGIDHFVFDFRDRFEKTVVDQFVSVYLGGGTPNPCIVCNRHIKFGQMLDKALELGYDKIATGHYARVKKNDNGKYLLYKAADQSKDQSYVLYSLTQEQLSRVAFPLGELTKSKVRDIAAGQELINADKPDSQDICFVPDGDYAAFIERNKGETSVPGDFVDKNGNILGKHGGIIRYTVGQRKGLGIAFGKPVFVLDKKVSSNQVVLGEEPDLFYKRVLVGDVNFIPFDTLDKETRVTAKLRYRHTEQPASIYAGEDGQIILEFDEPQRAPSPGQAAVFYDGDMVVGGGTVLKGID